MPVTPAPAMPTPSASTTGAPWLAGGGEMGERMRAMDWQPTALGARETWPQSLRSVVSTCLNSRFPMVILWGPQLTMLYNDAYAPLLGNKHPAALGRSIGAVWNEIADVITPLMQSVLDTGEATWIPDGFLALERHGAPEETYFSYSFGPVRIEDGSVGGILAVTIETTQRVVSERRLAFLKALADATGGAANVAEVCANVIAAMAAVEPATRDIPQAALYLRGPGGGEKLVAQAAPVEGATLTWPEQLPEQLPETIAPGQFAVPISTSDKIEAAGTLVVALNPLRPLDAAYRDFIAQVGRQIARAIADIKTLEGERARTNAELGLRRIFEQAPSFVCIMKGPEHVFEFVNNAHKALFNSAGWIGKPVRLAFPDISGQGYFEELDKVYQTGARYVATSAPVRFRHSLGDAEEVRLMDFIFEAIRDDEGHINGIFCEGFDVTAQRRAETTLREQEERLRALITSTANVVYTMSPDWAEMHPLDGKGFIADNQAPNRGWLDEYVYPDDQPRVRAAIAQAIKSERPFQFEHRVKTVDGAIGWTFSRAVPIKNAAGEITEWFGAATDITPRKKMEADLDDTRQHVEGQRRLYEAILNNTPDLAYVWNLNHRFIYANEGLLRMWGKTWDEAIGKHCIELGYEPWHAAMHDREIDQVVATGKPVRGDVPFNGTFGRRIYDYILVPVFGENGEVTAVAGTTRDVTDLRNMADQLRESDQRKEEFIGILAHELRNPLAPLRNGLEIIRRMAAQDSTVLQQARAMMDRQLAQMVRLIDDLLDISRISSGKIAIRKERVSLADIVRQAVETSQPVIDQAGHELSVTAPGHALFVDGDPTRLAQIFSNLVTNAAKFTPRGGHIRITIERDGDFATVCVHDDGAGIPAEMLDRIFDMFIQVDRSLEREKGGLGIGLYLARGLVNLHGGNIEAKSEGPGKGSQFIVRLPVAIDTSLDATGQNAATSPATLGVGRILIVDDNVDAATSLATLLELMGSQARVAHSGEEALKEAEAFKPELVFLDIGMPGMNGYETCTRLKQQPWSAGMTVVALTGWGQEKDRQLSREAGFDAHLVKPVGLDSIKALLDERAA